MLLDQDPDNVHEAQRARRRRRATAATWLVIVVGLCMIAMALAGRAS